MNTFSNLEIFLTNKLHDLLATYLSVFSSKVVLLLQSGVTILVFYYGYSVMTPGGSRATIQEMIFNLVRIAIVLAFVQNSAGLLDLSIGFIHELKTGFIAEKSLFALLDEQFLVAQKLSEDVFKLDTAYFKLQGITSSIMVWLGSIFMLASSAIVFIAAEFSLALLTVTSPIFIGCLTYGFTRELFNGWLRSIFSCIITLIFASLIVKIGIDINKQTLIQLTVSPEQKNLLHIGAIALGLGIISGSLTLVATKIAGNIASAATASATQGGMMLAAKAGFVSAGTTAVGAGIATKYASKGAVAVVKYAGGAIKNKVHSSRLKEVSQNASFARIQQENSKSDS